MARVRGVAGQVVEQVAEVDVGAVAQRDEVREADAARLGPVEHRGDQRARLRDEGELAGAARRCARSSRSGPMPGTSRPRQFGPEHAQQVRPRGVEHRLLAARASQARRVITIAARVPSAPSSPISAGTVAGGVQITARSGACGRSATRAKHRLAVERRVLRVDGVDRARRSRRRAGCASTVAPTLPGRCDAPITATERGVSRRSRWRIVTGSSRARGGAGVCLRRGAATRRRSPAPPAAATPDGSPVAKGKRRRHDGHRPFTRRYRARGEEPVPRSMVCRGLLRWRSCFPLRPAEDESDVHRRQPACPHRLAPRPPHRPAVPPPSSASAAPWRCCSSGSRSRAACCMPATRLPGRRALRQPATSLNSGFFKIVNLARRRPRAGGRPALQGRLARLRRHRRAASYGCDAVAMDTGEVWAIRYDALLAACAAQPALLARAARGDEPRDRPRPRLA